MSTGLPLFDASFPSLVHPPEIKSHSPENAGGGLDLGPPSLAETFRHSGWRRSRRLVYDSLRRTFQSQSRILGFCDCGYSAFVYRSVDPPHAYRLAGSSCHDKFCTPCARDRSHTIAANVLKHLQGKSVRFATLTIKHSGQTLGGQLDRLYAAFRKMRLSRVWKRHVVGGAAFLEIKWSEHSQSWHPHLHTIIQGRFFPREALSAAWWKATGDSMVTDIRAIKDEKKIASYVAKYASKSVNDTFIGRPDRLDEAVVALRGRRLCLTFGTWRGLKLTESPNDRDWESLGSLHDVCLRALSGDSECAFAIERICGPRAEEMLASVHAALPPPMKVRTPTDQLFFAFSPGGVGYAG